MASMLESATALDNVAIETPRVRILPDGRMTREKKRRSLSRLSAEDVGHVGVGGQRPSQCEGRRAPVLLQGRPRRLYPRRRRIVPIITLKCETPACLALASGAAGVMSICSEQDDNYVQQC